MPRCGINSRMLTFDCVDNGFFFNAIDTVGDCTSAGRDIMGCAVVVSRGGNIPGVPRTLMFSSVDSTCS